MGLFVLTFLIFLLCIGALAISLLLNRRPLQGSCGGVSVQNKARCIANCDKPCPNKEPTTQHEQLLQRREIS